MKVTEIRKDNRTGETFEVSWGEAIKSDFSIINSVVSIIEMERAPSRGPFADRFTTVAINIEL